MLPYLDRHRVRIRVDNCHNQLGVIIELLAIEINV
jgi:hypothetical protein